MSAAVASRAGLRNGAPRAGAASRTIRHAPDIVGTAVFTIVYLLGSGL